MRRRFFNAADNFVGGCYNKLSNEDIKRLGGKRPYVCQFNKIHGDYIQLYTTNIPNCFYL